MKIVKSNRSFCHFFPALLKTFFMLEMISKHLLNTKNGSAQVKWIVVHLLKQYEGNKKKFPGSCNSEFLMKLKFLTYVTQKFCFH